MIVVPALVLPRDDELEILGRTVEQTLGRSVESIDVIGRGAACVSLLQRNVYHHCRLTNALPPS
jgi:hypothetical protein